MKNFVRAFQYLRSGSGVSTNTQLQGQRRHIGGLRRNRDGIGSLSFLSTSVSTEKEDICTRPRPSINSVTYWCGSEKMVDEAHRFFTDVLRCVSLQEPFLEETSKSSRVIVSKGAAVYTSSVVLNGTIVEFISYPIVSRIRNLFSLTERCSLLSIGISHPSLLESRNADLLNRSLILPLALTNYAHISPVLVGRESHKDFSNTNLEMTVKEIVLGMDDDCLDDITNKIFLISDDVVGPCITRFAKGDSVSNASGSTNLRVIPSYASTVILKVENRKQFIDDIFDFDHTSLCSLNEIGRSGGHDGDVLVQVHSLPGLDIRISDSAKTQAFFYEIPQANAQDTAQFGGRTDMGNMSCVSVVGMEGKERMFRMPGQWIKSFSKM